MSYLLPEITVSCHLELLGLLVILVWACVNATRTKKGRSRLGGAIWTT